MRLVLAAAFLSACGNDEVVPFDALPAVDAAAAILDAAATDAEASDAPTDASPAQGCVASKSPVHVWEGGVAMVGIRLAAPPTGSVDVALAITDTSVATVTPTTLTFTADNHATPQMVQVYGVQDVDVLDDVTELSCAVPGAIATNIPIAVEDISDPFLDISVTMLTVQEGSTGTFGVRLQAQPPAAVTVTVMSLDESALTASPSTITITPTDWNMWHPVTVAGVADVDLLDEVVMVRLSGTGVHTRNVDVTVIDDD